MLDEKPSLRQYLPNILTKGYRNARWEASAETGINLANFGENCPYKIEEILNHQFLCNTTYDFERAIDKE